MKHGYLGSCMQRNLCYPGFPCMRAWDLLTACIIEVMRAFIKEPEPELYDQQKHEYINQSWLHLCYPTQRLDILCVCLPHACHSANEPILSPANNLCWGWNIFPVVHQKNWQANKADRCSSDCEDFLVRLFFPRSTNYQSHGRYEYPLSFVCSCKSLAFADVSWWCGKPGSGGLLQWLGLKILPVDLADGDFNFVTCKVRVTNQTWAEAKR